MIKELTLDQFKPIYDHYLFYDFVENERKPFSIIEKEVKQKIAILLGFYENQTLLGYAILQKGKHCLLLDYLAILPHYRHQNYGSQFLSELKTYFADADGLIIESEKPFDELSEKRIQFYLKNHAFISSLHLTLYFVDYHVLFFPICQHYSDSRLYQELCSIYNLIYPIEFQKQYLVLKEFA